jgi:hypothetical protein
LEMVRLLVLFAAISSMASSIALAAGFSLTIGSPVAAGVGSKVVKSKGASFAVRMEECDDPGKAQLTASAEGLVNGARSSVAVMPVPAGLPGVYLVAQNWPPEGVWVVSLIGTCGGGKAGAIVPMSNQGFVREALEFFPRPPAAAEIQQALLNADKKLMTKP